MNEIERTRFNQENAELIATVAANPEWWDWRKVLVANMYNAGLYEEAAELVWNAPEIPPVDNQLAFALKILARGKTRRAIRLMHELLSRGTRNPIKLISMARALADVGMVMASARFYGAACVIDESLIDPQFEFWLQWADEDGKLWGQWEESPRVEELPWIRLSELTGIEAPFADKFNLPGLPQIDESGMHLGYCDEKQIVSEFPEPPPPLLGRIEEHLKAQPRRTDRLPITIDQAPAAAAPEQLPSSADTQPLVPVAQPVAPSQPALLNTAAVDVGPSSLLARMQTGAVPTTSGHPAPPEQTPAQRRLIVPSGVNANTGSIQIGGVDETPAMRKTRRIEMPSDIPVKTKPVHLITVPKANSIEPAQKTANPAAVPQPRPMAPRPMAPPPTGDQQQ